MDLGLKGRMAVVTGAAQGIGLAISRTLRAEGMDLLLVDRAETVNGVAEELGVSAISVDLATPMAPDEVREAADEIGPCAVLVNNAGISRPAAFDAITGEDWRAVMGVNIDAAFRLTQALWPRLRQTRGAVINMASSAAKRATLYGNNTSYVVSKHAIAGLTRAAAMDGAAAGIRVNAVAPGVVATDMVRLHDVETRARIQGMIPLGRYADPDEIADAVAFLASERASHVTGEILNVNGGLVMD